MHERWSTSRGRLLHQCERRLVVPQVAGAVSAQRQPEVLDTEILHRGDLGDFVGVARLLTAQVDHDSDLVFLEHPAHQGAVNLPTAVEEPWFDYAEPPGHEVISQGPLPNALGENNERKESEREREALAPSARGWALCRGGPSHHTQTDLT